MNQSKLESLIESILNTASGFIISMFVWKFAVAPAIGLEASFLQSVGVTLVFTIVSIVRGYYWRRFFAKGLHKIVQKRVAMLYKLVI